MIGLHRRVIDPFPPPAPRCMRMQSSRLRCSSAPHQNGGIENDLGFGFSAGGLLFPYYIGLVSGLTAKGVIRPDTKLAGASAGSLIACLAKAGLSEEALMNATLDMARDLRQNGTVTRIRSVLKKKLEDALPPDIHHRCSGVSFVAVTRLEPTGGSFLKNDLISDFNSRDHLIEALLTSCHVPLWLDGKPYTTFEGGLALDGGLTSFIPVPPGVKRPIRVACFPRKSLGSTFGNISISPDAFEDSFSCYSMRDYISMALNPASDEMLQSLAAKGKRDAEHAFDFLNGRDNGKEVMLQQ